MSRSYYPDPSRAAQKGYLKLQILGTHQIILYWNQNPRDFFFFFLSKVPKWFLGTLKFVSQSMWCWRDRATLRSLKEYQVFSKCIHCMTFFFLHIREVKRWVLVAYLLPPGFNRQRLGYCVHLVWYFNQGINKFCRVGSCSEWFMGS